MKITYSIYRMVAHSLLLLVVLILQQTPNVIPKMFNRSPNLVLAAFSVMILFERPKIVAWFGFFIGLILSAYWGDPMNIQAIVICIFSYLLGYISERYLRKFFVVAIAISTFFLILFYHVQFFYFYILKGYDHIQYAYLNHCLINILYTWLFVPVFYFFNKLFISKIKDANI